MPNYTFCEIVFGYSRWHIRDIDDEAPHYPKSRHKRQAVTLCGLSSVRDIENTPIGPYNLNRNTCVHCAKAYIDLKAKENRSG
jgi:hypothetical protein